MACPAIAGKDSITSSRLTSEDRDELVGASVESLSTFSVMGTVSFNSLKVTKGRGKRNLDQQRDVEGKIFILVTIFASTTKIKQKNYDRDVTKTMRSSNLI